MNKLELYNLFSDFRIERDDAKYPPYHDGPHLEEHFVAKYFNEFKKTDNKRLFLPIHWTAVFNHRVSEGLGPSTENYALRQKLFKIISTLPQDLEYFTVSTHDDAPQGNFPVNTKHFYAGGNSTIGTDAIPLVCSPLKYDNDPQKLVFCSFVGSATNQLRNNLLQHFHNKDGYVVNAFHWRPDVTLDQQELFLECTARSRFAFCPRGYGATSYRLYEAMQLGAVPIYYSDKHLLPWSEDLNWNDFCIVVSAATNFDDLDSYLKNMKESEVRKMQDKIREVYPLYFTIPAVYNEINKRIK